MLPVAIALGAYLLAGAFWDLPPYAVALVGSTTRIALTRTVATVDTDLTYLSSSRRETTVYLPYETGGGVEQATGLAGEVSPPSTFLARPDGVLLTLRLLPRQASTVHFHFSQALSDHHFTYDFSLERGWLRQPAPATYHVVSSMPTWVNRVGIAVFREQSIEQDVSGKGLELRW